MFRWGVLSTAKIARDQVIPQLQDSENGVVAAIASRDLEKGRALAARFSIPRVHGSYDALLADPEVDGVYIPLPTSQHVEWTLRAIEAGKHVLCEKPIALEASQIEPLIAARNRKGVVVSEAFMVTYHPQWAKVRELVRDGSIGRLRQVQGAFTYYNVDPMNMRNQPGLGGGGLPDIGVYPTVATRFVTSAEPKRLRATIERDPTFGTDIFADVTADFGEFHLSFYCSTQMALRQSMIFHGDRGYIEVSAPFNAGDYGHATVTLHDQRQTGASIFRFPGVRQYRLQAEAFVRRAQGGTDAVFPLEDSVRNQKVIDACYRAAGHDGWEAV
jgi:Predicted dehydrogenases and related proteins